MKVTMHPETYRCFAVWDRPDDPPIVRVGEVAVEPILDPDFPEGEILIEDHPERPGPWTVFEMPAFRWRPEPFRWRPEPERKEREGE